MLDQPTLMPPGTSQTDLRRIYGSLSDDLGAAARNAGGDPAYQAWQGANALNQQVQQQRQELTAILGAKSDASNEDVYNRIMNAASSGKSGDAMLLERARQSMAPDAWNGIASAVTDGLGKVTNDEGQTTFSVAKFLTNYGKLSDAGKASLYAGRPDLANALDDLRTLGGRYKASQAMENVSKTASHLEGGGLMALVLTGHLLSAMKLGLPALGASWWLSRPATVRAATGWAKLYSLAGKIPQALIQGGARRFAAQLGVQLGLSRPRIDLLTRGLMATLPGGAQSGAVANAQNNPIP
jgi:hypothetical protein